MIYRFIFFLCLQCFAVAAFAQPVNLVPNGGFEERVECIYNDGILSDAPPWFNPMDPEYIDQATPDLFHACGIVNENPCPYPENGNTNDWFFGVPTNFMGCESPYEGEGYAGAFLFFPSTENELDGYREYCAVRLIEPLQAGHSYDVSMQVSLAERSTHAIWNFQLLLLADSLVQETTQYIDYEPQLNGIPGDYIDNKDGWRELSWTYTAEGGEQFIYLGNFQPNSETDTLFVTEGSLQYHYYPGVYYYIDDVKISTTSLSSGVNERVAIGIFPNPSADVFFLSGIEYSGLEGIQCNVEIFDLHGRKLHSANIVLSNTAAVDLSNLPSGIYIMRLSDKHKINITEKIIKR